MGIIQDIFREYSPAYHQKYGERIPAEIGIARRVRTKRDWIGWTARYLFRFPDHIS